MIRWKDFECDLQSTYRDGTAKITETDYKLLNYNRDSNGIRVTIKDGGENFTFTNNDTVAGYVLCSNGATYQAATKGKDGNKAWFIVPPDVYNYTGPCIVSILIVTGNVQSVVLAARMTIDKIVSLPVLSPTSVVADITNITSLLETMALAKQEALDAAAFLPNTIAPAYASNTAYSAGDYITDSGKLYRVTADITAANNTALSAVSKTQVTAGAELGDLKSAIEHSSVFGLNYETLAANDYQTGRYNATSGSRQGQNSTAYICTKDYLPSDVASVSVADGYKVGVHVWDTSKDPVEHIGMITSTGIRLNSGTDGQLTESTDLTRYPDTYKFKLDLFAPSDGAVYYDTDYNKISLGYKTDKTLSIDRVPADAKAVGDALNDKLDIADAIPKPTTAGEEGQYLKLGSNGTTEWATVSASGSVVTNYEKLIPNNFGQGRYNSTSGASQTTASTAYIRTLSYLPSGVMAVSVEDGYTMGIHVWDTSTDEDVYQGMITANGIKINSGVAGVLSERTDISNYPSTYKFKVVLNAPADGAVYWYADYDKINLGYATDKTLTGNGVPADAKSVGDLLGVEYTDIPTFESDWTQGGINVANGNNANSDARIRMTAPDGVTSAKVISGANMLFWAFCWAGDAYQGGWTGSGFTKSSNSLVTFSELDFTPIYAVGVTTIVIVAMVGTNNAQNILTSAGVDIKFVKYDNVVKKIHKIDKLDANLTATHDYDFWVEKQVINTNQTIGDTVDITPTTNGSFNHQIIPVKKGDKLVITDEGGRDARAWAFTDTDYKLLSAASQNAVCAGVEQTATEDGYLIVNHKRASTTTPSIVKIGYLNADETVKDVDALKKSAVSLDTRVGILERIPKARFEIDHTLKDVSSIVSQINYSQSEINPDTGRVWRADLMFQIYDLFDELAEDYPDLVTKYDAASEAWLGSGNAIAYPAYANGVSSGDPDYLETPAYRTYIYKISNITTGAGNNQSNKKRAFFVGGTHGGEVGSPFNLYIFAKLLCGIADENYFKLLSTFDFYILPCLDGYTMIHYDDPASGALRMNANLVNINRNFPIANWTEAGEGTYDYTGPSPASEFETQIVIAATNKIHPDLAIDHHTYHDVARQFYSEICNSKFMPLAYQALVDCSAAFIKCLPQYFGTKYQLFVEDSYAFAPKAPLSHASGRTSVWWDEAGVPFAATVEINGSISFLNGEYHMRQNAYGNDMFSVGEYTFRTQVLLYAQWVLDNA